jgi:hypothetical protein
MNTTQLLDYISARTTIVVWKDEGQPIKARELV